MRNTISAGLRVKRLWRHRRLLVAMSAVLLLGACAEARFAVHSAKRVVGAVEDKGESSYKVGKPYQIEGVWYYPKEDFNYDETGIASWYGTKFHGRKTANGEIYDMNALTAAHRTLPMPSYVRVTNLENGRSLVLKVNDRGPFARGRIIDISRRGSQLLGFQKAGTAKVRVQILADKSRALAVRVKNRAELAKVGSPITVKRLPKAKVKSESVLPPPPTAANRGTVTTAPLPPSEQKLITQAPAPTVMTPPQRISRDLTPAVTGKVSQTAVGASKIYVQAGAFGKYANANQVKARLTPVGPVNISSVLVNGRDLFRVRVGPLTNVAAADRMLDAVTKVGYTNARIIIE